MSAFKCIILVLGFTTFIAGCAATHSDSSATGNKPAALKTPQGSQAISVRPASDSECAAGGEVYSIYQDFNSNGSMDEGEQPLSTQVVCNGLNGSNGSNGSNGISSLFSMLRVTTGLAACSSGSGLQFNYGLDSDGSHILEPSEVTQVQVLCDGHDGSAGAAGPAGPAGQNGHAMAFETMSASAAQCSNGGSVVLMSIDVHDNGVYSPLNPGQQAMVMCNGLNGTNGSNGSNGTNGTNGQDGHDGQNGVTPAYSTVEPILPCGNTVAYKEVLLRLQNGQVLGSFSQDVHGEMTRLAFLPDGSYIDTDTSGCTFSLATSPDGNTRFISWFNQVQMSWPMSH